MNSQPMHNLPVFINLFLQRACTKEQIPRKYINLMESSVWRLTSNVLMLVTQSGVLLDAVFTSVSNSFLMHLVFNLNSFWLLG